MAVPQNTTSRSGQRTSLNIDGEQFINLNERGLTEKRIEYTNKSSTMGGIQPSETLTYDTLDFEYHAPAC